MVGTCRQIYAESKGIFWSKNKFLIPGLWGHYYFSYGLGPHRRRYLTCVGTIWFYFVNHPVTAAWQTESVLGSSWGCHSAMSNIAHRPSSEYGFVYKILDAMESRSENFNEKLDRYRQRSAKVEAKRNREDGTAVAVLDADGQLRDTVDILSEAIHSYGEQRSERMKRSRRGWHIEFKWFWYRDKSCRMCWVTNAPTMSTYLS